jgi:phage terminase large subunit-like protein
MDEENLPIIPIKPDKDKITRFQPTAQFYANDRIWHASDLPVYFEDELTLFPIAEHDDMCDALAYAIMSFGSYWDEDQGPGRFWTKQAGEEPSGDVWEAA